MMTRFAIIPALPREFENIAYYTGGVSPHGWSRQVGDEISQGAILSEYQEFKFYSPVGGRVVHCGGILGAKMGWTYELWNKPPWSLVPNYEILSWLSRNEREASLVAFIIETNHSTSNVPLHLVFRDLINYCDERLEFKKSWAISQIIPPSGGPGPYSFCALGTRILFGSGKTNFLDKEKKISNYLQLIKKSNVLFR